LEKIFASLKRDDVRGFVFRLLWFQFSVEISPPLIQIGKSGIAFAIFVVAAVCGYEVIQLHSHEGGNRSRLFLVEQQRSGDR